MKKIILIILLLCVCFASEAQNTWPDPDAKWHYCISNNGENIGSELWEIIGDTTINDLNYSIISETENQQNKNRIITRYDNDTVYRYVNDKEYMFFTFNLEEGDVFTTFRSAGWNSWNDSACSSSLPLKVIEKNTIMYNNQEYNKFLLYDTLFSYLYGIDKTVIYELVEPIGIINAYPFINLQETWHCDLVSDYPQVEVFLYEDGENNIFMSECKPTNVKEEMTYSCYDITPNPVKDHFRITINDILLYGSKMTLYSVNGIKLEEFYITEKTTEINMDNCQDGLYFVVVDCPSGNKTIKKIIKNKSL